MKYLLQERHSLTTLGELSFKFKVSRRFAVSYENEVYSFNQYGNNQAHTFRDLKLKGRYAWTWEVARLDLVDR